MARLFRPYNKEAKSETAVSDPAPVEETGVDAQGRRVPKKKDAPTPRRKDAEKARLERVNPTLTRKEAKKRAAEANREKRMAALEARDSTPEKLLMRDVVDSRFNLGEVLLPTLMLVLALSFVQPYWPQAANASIILMYTFIVLVIVDLFVLWRKFKKIWEERHPGRSTKGTGVMMYGWNRAIQLRPLRMPKPTVKRGDKI
ncbi:DUF3043 domain-containing protein [Mariniluteicoccus endophyticus]